MSYPMALQVLVVEDDEDAKEAYKEVFENISRSGHLRFPLAPPCFCFSHEEALREIEGSKIFHVVILDLRLPRRSGVPPADDVDLGLDLLGRLQQRDTFPVPAILVVSGHIGTTDQASMQESLRSGFYYGRSLVKNLAVIESELIKACDHAIKYGAIGIHLRSSGAELYPTLDPRDEDLLRRSVLEDYDGIGLDLTWWSARSVALFDANSRSIAFTKVFMGRTLLGDGRGASRPKFFKLFPASDAPSVVKSLRFLEQKLSHIKSLGTVSSRSVVLTVTEKVGVVNERPTSLDDYLKVGDLEAVVRIATQTVAQTSQLGDLLEESRPLKSILWKHHDASRIKTVYEGADATSELFSDCDPVKLFEKLSSCDRKVRPKERSLTHGDLHVKNVAVDVSSTQVDAYIFDPAAKRDISGRDLAMLEVSVILHVPMDQTVFRQVSARLYGDSTAEADDTTSITDLTGRNVVAFVLSIREGALASNALEVYSLMVLDQALIQLGGLAFSSSGNLIADKRSAHALVRWSAEWYCRCRPDQPTSVAP